MLQEDLVNKIVKKNDGSLKVQALNQRRRVLPGSRLNSGKN